MELCSDKQTCRNHNEAVQRRQSSPYTHTLARRRHSILHMISQFICHPLEQVQARGLLIGAHRVREEGPAC